MLRRLTSHQSRVRRVNKLLVTVQIGARSGGTVTRPGQTVTRPGQTVTRPYQTVTRPVQNETLLGHTVILSGQTLIFLGQTLTRPGQSVTIVMMTLVSSQLLVNQLPFIQISRLIAI